MNKILFWIKTFARRCVTRCEGVALVEFALILPILVLMLLGGFEATRLLQSERYMRGIGNSVAQSMDAVCYLPDPMPDYITAAIQHTAYWLDIDDLKVTFRNIVYANGVYTENWIWTNQGDAIPADYEMVFSGLLRHRESAFLVDVQYTFRPRIFGDLFSESVLEHQSVHFPLASRRVKWFPGERALCSNG